MPFLVTAEIAVPTAGECLRVLAPIVALILFNWLLQNIDAIIHRLFPQLEWEKRLGWLNIKSERRAAAVLRTLGVLVYILLAAALCGIVWSAVGLAQAGGLPDSQGFSKLSDRLPILLACLVLWALYLAGHLVPRLRREHEEEELERFRAELSDLERQSEEESRARTPHAPLLGTKASLPSHSRSQK